MKNVVLVCMLVLAMAASAQALQAWNTTTNTLLHRNLGFENDTVGSSPSYASPGTMIGYPTDTVLTGGVGAYEGDNYLETIRTAAGGSGNPSHWFSAQMATAGEQMHADFAIYLPSSGNETTLGLYDPAGVSGYYRTLSWIADGALSAYDGVGYQAQGNLTMDKWLVASMDYTIGASTGTLTIDGTGYTMYTFAGWGTAIWTPNGGPTSGVYFGHNSNDKPAYLDGVPEPMTMALLGLGGLALIRRRRS